MTCSDCIAAKTNPHHAGFHARCEGCQIRALASGPEFFDARRFGTFLPGYRKALEAMFGKEWEAAHAKVKAEYARLQGMRKEAA